MKQVWIMEDFDFRNQAWALVAMGDSPVEVHDKGMQTIAEDGFLWETRTRQIWVGV